MNHEVKTSLKSALREALSILERFPMTQKDIHTSWRREKQGSWTAVTELRPSLTPVFIKGPADWDKLTADATRAFQRHHPDYLAYVGTAAGTLPVCPANLLQIMISQLWRRHATWSLGDDILNAFLDEFAHSIDDPVIPLTFVAQLLNLHLDEGIGSIALPNGLTIRALTDEEFSEIYGASSLAESFTFLPRPRFLHEFAIAGEYQVRKLANESLPQTPAYTDLHESLTRTVLAFRTFKKGRIGYEIVNLQPRYFCPYLFQNRIGGVEYIPMGLYQLSESEVTAFQEHARLVFVDLDASLEIACSRLGDAENRLQPRDAVMDAVIGLEAILLARAGKEEYRGEMRYRFSLNYSSLLVGPEERQRAFYTARSLYDLRSTIAHGGHVKEPVAIGEEKVTLHKAAEMICEILRAAIKRFLPGGKNPAYLGQHFWENAYFGLEAEKGRV